jgi:uncharacterized protein YabN with tetrapyrrole methylase and pyrophosphatase domain
MNSTQKYISILEQIPKNLNALEDAIQTTQQVHESGFTWGCIEEAMAKIPEELDEIKQALAQKAPIAEIEAEFGDLILAVISLCAYAKIDTQRVLEKALNKFKNRFQVVEKALVERHQPIAGTPLNELMIEWKAAKKLFP